jgi:PTH1 family peptidyl-tRNA hydrolase
MKLFVGLGNPGRGYRLMRHNVGFMAVDFIAKKERLSFRTRHNYEFCETSSSGDKVFLLKPATFMNASGEAVERFLKYHPMAAGDICVFLDDAVLPLGSIRIREKGTDGGQKGLRDIIRVLGTDEVPRVRFGIGPQPDRVPLEDFVLSDFPKSDLKLVEETVARAHDIYALILEGRPLVKIMNEYNRTTRTDDPEA